MRRSSFVMATATGVLSPQSAVLSPKFSVARGRGYTEASMKVRIGLSLFLLATLSFAAEAPSRVVVLCFDGVDASVVEAMAGQGRLPNLTALGKRGRYSALTPTVPAQTPVSWSTFATGLDPGGHEIFDFLKRNPADRVPTFAVAEEVEKPLLLGRPTGPVA